MQKDLLAELHLHKLNLKSFQNILVQNSGRAACLVKGRNKYGEKTNTISPGFKVIVGASVPDYADSKLSSPPMGENAKMVNKRIVFKKTLCPIEYNLSNDFKKPPPAALGSNSIVTFSSVQEPVVRENRKKVGCELSRTSLLKSKISSKEPGLSTNPKNSSSACAETKCLRDIIASKYSDEEAEVEILLETNTKNSSNSNRSVLLQKTLVPEPKTAAVSIPDVNEITNETEPQSKPFCVISEVVGNANTTFSDVEESQENETLEPQLITPKKTNDITKIKGWRRKQFFVEKPTAVEFYEFSKGSRSLKRKIDLKKIFEIPELTEEPGNKETAFSCDSLDEFLEREADLKINYEIPHLYAEFGIKLTKDEIVSRPNLHEKEIKEIETRYCRAVSLPNDNYNLDDIKEEDFKPLKRSIEDDTKPWKIQKVDVSKNQETVSEVNCFKSGVRTSLLKQNKCVSRDIKLSSKLIALVVYPGPYVPLHPLVQYHLNKLRSYRTVVDKRWAKFAVSAVLVNKRRLKRKILPAYCCVKVEKNPSAETAKIEERKEGKKEIKIKPCSVVIEKLDCPEVFLPWCMDHSCYNCEPCGLTQQELPTEKFSPRECFKRKIVRLLGKKVRLLKANGDTPTSIDCLKVLKRDTIEFIKLKFVKESFLTGYINIWYLGPQMNGTRSRAFLTFSKSSPVQNAVNLRSTGISMEHLPKVITEIVSTENTFDSNEYAILHCNGRIWEIHGSLNISFGENVRQIFTSLELPELKKLQEIAFEILHVEAVKWWVLDLTQKFKLIELKWGGISTVITRKKFFEIIALNLYGFLPLKKDSENRVVGAYVIQRLLPFVLIGPYYLLENQDMILKGVSSTVPFKYYGEENVTTNNPLKFFINSVIKNLELDHCQLEGLWLYDKMCFDKTSYIEIVTKKSEDIPSPSNFSSIEIEHGYSLNSLTYTSPSGAASGIVKRRDGKNELQTVTVYLYFDIFELGFVEGELQFDNSVIISHPLDERTKMKSHKIGDWFINIIKRRVKFVPKDMVVRWFITKHKSDLNGRIPFNKFILGGAHILAKDGVYYLLEMTESERDKLGLGKNEIVKTLSNCEVLKEVIELRNLADLFADGSNKSLMMNEVLTRTVNEIKTLRRLQKSALEEKMLEEQKKLFLVAEFLKLVNSFRVQHNFKVQMIFDIQHMFVGKDGCLINDYVKNLRKHRVGCEYLKRLEKLESKDPREGVKYKVNINKKDKHQFKNCKRFMLHLQKNFENTKSILKHPENSFSEKAKDAEESNFQMKHTIIHPNSGQFSSFKIKEGFLKLTSTKLPTNMKISFKNCNGNRLKVCELKSE